MRVWLPEGERIRRPRVRGGHAPLHQREGCLPDEQLLRQSRPSEEGHISRLYITAYAPGKMARNGPIGRSVRETTAILAAQPGQKSEEIQAGDHVTSGVPRPWAGKRRPVTRAAKQRPLLFSQASGTRA